MEETKIPIPAQEFSSQMHPWQLEIFQKFDNKEFRFAILNWHRRARKTTLGINILIRECCRYPNKVYGYIAPTYTQAKGIIWRDPNMLMRYLPPEPIVKRKNETELFVEFNNNSILAIKGADNPDSIRGQDYEGVFVDEYALIDKAIWEEILRPIITPNPNRWAIFAFTPKGINHAYDYWNKAEKWDGWYRSLLKASVSNLIDRLELEKAKREMPVELYNQEFECDFLSGDENTLIKPYMLELLIPVVHNFLRSRKIVACDPSLGGDECTIKVMDNCEVIEEKILHEDNTMVIVGEIDLLMFKHKTNNYVGDVIGFPGIADRLEELGKNVIRINSAEEAEDKERFANRRAEIWWKVMEKIQRREIPYPQNAETRRQLCAPKYKLMSSSGRIILEPKEQTKKFLGRSPDDADCFVYGVEGTEQIIEDNEINSESFRALKKKPVFVGAAGW